MGSGREPPSATIRDVTAPQEFLRVQATYRGRLGVEVGVFVAVDHLRRAGVLSAEEESTFFDVEDWFIEHLPNPDFYADGNSIGAVTWFRTPVPEPMRARVDVLCGILRAHGVEFDVVRSADPGDVVYEDDFQVGVVPRERGEPTPLPDGVVRSPTTSGSKRSVASSAIRHVLFDADGVLQAVPGDDWYALAEPYVGARAREFLHRAWELERPALAGHGEFLPLLADLLAEYDVDASAQEVFDGAWCRVAPVPATVAIVRALRSNGYGVHLGTNQDANRADFLRAAFGYDDLFDTSTYSCEVGVAKPAVAFFDQTARRIGAAPETVLFVDDSLANVEGAREAGMVAVHWTVTDGHDALLDRLAQHGVDGRHTVAAPAAVRDGGPAGLVR
jgi:HAD superfamily hydrolase (TIGR01509 family)